MARSTSIWLIMNNHAEPIAAFTVKHEMLTWVTRQRNEGRLVENWVLIRFPDNPRDPYRVDADQRRPEILDLEAELCRS